MLAGALLAWIGAGPLRAHDGEPLAPHDLWGAWAQEPWVLPGMVLFVGLYVRGIVRLWGRAGLGRGVRRWQAGCFAGGTIALLVALVSPLDAMGSALFSAHMLQHEILMLIAAPLVVLSAPHIAVLWALPIGWRRRIGALARVRPVRAAWRMLSRPLAAWVIYAMVLWIWHAPGLYQATLESDLVHAAQHGSFLGGALLFWWVLLESGRHGSMGWGGGVLYVFTTAVHGSALGALLTFAPTPWYPMYADSVEAWGLTVLQDQQLGGLIMWIPAGVVYVGTALALMIVWLRSIERRVKTRPVGTGAATLVLGLGLLLSACDGEPRPARATVSGGNAEQGPALIRAHGCGGCHTVEGVRGANGRVGPPLNTVGARMYIAGRLPNTPDNLVRWIMDPQEVDPGNAMPDMSVPESEARDIAAYLYSLP